MFKLALLFEGGLVLAAMLLGMLTGYPAGATFRWNAADCATGALAGAALFAVLWALVRWPLGPPGRLVRWVEEHVVPMFENRGALGLLLLCLLAGWGEEWLFRGVIQAALADRFGATGGLLLASALFGAGHAVTCAYAVAAGLIGGFFGWLWLETGNLLVPTTAHALYDFLALWYLAKRRRALHPTAPGSEETSEQSRP